MSSPRFAISVSRTLAAQQNIAIKADVCIAKKIVSTLLETLRMSTWIVFHSSALFTQSRVMLNRTDHLSSISSRKLVTWKAQCNDAKYKPAWKTITIESQSWYGEIESSEVLMRTICAAPLHSQNVLNRAKRFMLL